MKGLNKMRHRKVDGKRAMTMVEVVIAMALTIVCIGGILAVLLQNTSLGQSVDSSYVAVNIAKSRIERIRQIRRDMSYDDVIDAAETDTIVDRNGVANPSGDYSRTTIIDPTFASNLTQVTVRVKYKQGGVFIPTGVELVTLVSPYS